MIAIINVHYDKTEYILCSRGTKLDIFNLDLLMKKIETNNLEIKTITEH